jgi:hypothetical protein
MRQLIWWRFWVSRTIRFILLTRIGEDRSSSKFWENNACNFSHTIQSQVYIRAPSVDLLGRADLEKAISLSSRMLDGLE